MIYGLDKKRKVMYKLYNIKINTDDDNFYQLTPDSDSIQYGAVKHAIKASPEMLKRFLTRCKVSDQTTKPRSYRSITYKEIIQAIQKGECSVYVYAHMYPKTYDQLNSIMRK